jgi:soluble lytic murein transglycosylase-like protein
MDLVTLLTVCAIGSGTPPAHGHQYRDRALTLAAADPINRWEPLIAEASRRFGIPAEWIRAVIRAESAGRTTLDGRPITSPAGAIGLTQIMPETYENMRQALGLGGGGGAVAMAIDR